MFRIIDQNVQLLLCIAFCELSALTSSDAAAAPLQTSRDQASDSKERLPASCRCPPNPILSSLNDSEGNDMVKINYQIFAVDLSKMYTHKRRVIVFCRTGYFLAVTDQKKVIGTTNMSSDRILFEWQSMDTSIVRLKNVRTGRYLAINRKGRLMAQLKISHDSLFKARQELNDFHSFASHKYFTVHRHNLFLGIKQNGRCKSPKQTHPGQTAVQFVLLDENFNRTEEKYKAQNFLTHDTSGRRSADD